MTISNAEFSVQTKLDKLNLIYFEKTNAMVALRLATTQVIIAAKNREEINTTLTMLDNILTKGITTQRKRIFRGNKIHEHTNTE